jgi:hypothetical protein
MHLFALPMTMRNLVIYPAFSTFLDTILSEEQYSSISPDIKKLIAHVIERQHKWIQSYIEEAIRQQLATPEQEVKAVKKIVFDTLYSTRGENRVRSIIKAHLAEIANEPDTAGVAPVELPARPQYHTSKEIQTIILASLDELYDNPMFSNTDFTLSTLKAYVKSRALLRKDDTDHRLTRNLSNAIKHWPADTNPFEKTSIRGRYRLRA